MINQARRKEGDFFGMGETWLSVSSPFFSFVKSHRIWLQGVLLTVPHKIRGRQRLVFWRIIRHDKFSNLNYGGKLMASENYAHSSLSSKPHKFPSFFFARCDRIEKSWEEKSKKVSQPLEKRGWGENTSFLFFFEGWMWHLGSFLPTFK